MHPKCAINCDDNRTYLLRARPAAIMSVEIDPVELGFRSMSPGSPSSPALSNRSGPFTMEVSQVLKIKNPNTSPIAFKVAQAGSFCILSISLTGAGQNDSSQAVCACWPILYTPSESEVN